MKFELDTSLLLSIFWKRRLLIISLAVLAATTAAIATFYEPQLYSAHVLVRLGRVWGEVVEDPYVLTEVASGQKFLEQVSKLLQYRVKPAQLARNLQVRRLEGGKARARYVYLIKVEATSEAPELAEQIARVAAEQLIVRADRRFDAALEAARSRERQLESRLKSLAPEENREEAYELERQLSEVRLNSQSPLRTYHSEIVEESPAEPLARRSRLRTIAIGALAGLLLGLVAAGLGELKSLRTEDVPR